MRSCLFILLPNKNNEIATGFVKFSYVQKWDSALNRMDLIVITATIILTQRETCTSLWPSGLTVPSTFSSVEIAAVGGEGNTRDLRLQGRSP